MSQRRPMRLAVTAGRSAAAVLLIALSAGPAMAYVDPGTGSMFVQMAVAVVAGALFYFREMRTRIVDRVRRLRGGTPTRQQTSASETDKPSPDVQP